MTSRTPGQRGDPGQQVDPLLGGQAADVPRDHLTIRRQRGPQLLAPLGRVEAPRVHAAPPQPDVADALAEQAGRGDRGRGERARGTVVDAAQPPPGERLPGPAEPVGPGVGGQVGLVHRDRGQAEPPGHRGAVRPEEHRAGQVHHVGPVPDERGPDLPAGQPQPEAGIAGQRHGGHAHHRERVGVLLLLPRFAWRPGRDDQRVVAVAGEEFGDAEDGVGDAVDVGRERFGDDRDPHAYTVRYQPIRAWQPP